MNKKGYIITIYSLAHLVVDFSCAFLMFSRVNNSSQWYLCILLYNFCAFAMQMPIGLLADKINRNAIFAAAGCAFVALSFSISNFFVPCAVIAGLGNGLFHVGGGIDVLNVSKEKSSALGIFVSPGAFGLYLGTLFGKKSELSSILIVVILLAMAAAILAICYKVKGSFVSDNSPVSFKNMDSPAFLLAVISLFIVVCLRSYVGMLLDFPWKAEKSWGLILICAIVLGKACGGILADAIGSFKASFLSLGISAILFVFSQYPVAGILAVFLFNMTMPITLWAVARILPGVKGFSFGLLTFGLFLGFMPVYFGLNPIIHTSLGFAMASLISLGLLLFGLRKAVVQE
ncbi:MAG: MFS transporter [Clostridiaceae bacterium]|nr:MFS transporter [Clostridiaceae bacterium]